MCDAGNISHGTVMSMGGSGNIRAKATKSEKEGRAQHVEFVSRMVLEIEQYNTRTMTREGPDSSD